MRVVIAPDKLKGAISAEDACRAIERGIRGVCRDAQIVCCPMADGGEGTVAALVSATGGRIERATVCGPRPEMKIEAEFGILGDGQTAVIEMAAASGLALLPLDQRNPLKTTTCGTGELILAAVRLGAKRIILGIGGSATTDGGIGALQALGFGFVMDGGMPGRPLVGEDLAKIQGVKPPAVMPDCEILIACDVENPLCGPEGAAAVYGPQKGATPEQVRQLDGWLKQFAEVTQTTDVATSKGSGAAGGLGYGLTAMIPGTRMEPGFALVAEALKFADLLRGANWCLTAEGRLNRSSLNGKTAVGVARMCREMGIGCAILAGSVEAEAEKQVAELGAVAMPIGDGPMTLQEAMTRTTELLERSAARVMRFVVGPEGPLCPSRES